MKNYYICTIDRIPCVYDGDQFVFAHDGFEIRKIAYKDLKSLRAAQRKSETWRREQGFGTRTGFNYWRIKL